MFDFRQTRPVVLAGAVRTPIGKFGGELRALSAIELGVAAATGRESRPMPWMKQFLGMHGKQVPGPTPHARSRSAQGFPSQRRRSRLIRHALQV